MGAARIAAAPGVAHGRAPATSRAPARPADHGRARGRRPRSVEVSATADAQDTREHRLQRGEIRRAHDGVGRALPERDAQARAGGRRQARRRGAAPSRAVPRMHWIARLRRPRRSDRDRRRPRRPRPPARARRRRGSRPSSRRPRSRDDDAGSRAARARPARGARWRGSAPPRSRWRSARPGRTSSSSDTGSRERVLRGIDDDETARSAASLRRVPSAKSSGVCQQPCSATTSGPLGRRAARHPHAVRPALERAPAERPAGRRVWAPAVRPTAIVSSTATSAARRREPAASRRQGRRARRGSSTRPCLTSQTPRGDSRTNGRKSAARKNSVNSGSWCG